ncbi:MAG: hypothetical protein AAFO95_02285 [Cyanobacteria bacterium J06600_6]
MSKISALKEKPFQSKSLSTEGELENIAPIRSFEVWKSKTVELKAKATYSFHNLITRPRYFLIFFLARFQVLRQIYAYGFRFKSHSLKTNAETDSLFELDPVPTVKTLKRDGVCGGLDLPSQFLNELQQYLLTQDCYAGGKTHLGFKINDKEELDRAFKQPFYVARYFNLSADCPQIRQLVNDPKLQQIATGYIGNQAQYTGASLFWTFPIQGVSVDADQQMFSHFHYDIDDFAGLRFCFYLTDVTLDDGPHVCIQGSHIHKRISYILNFFSRIQTSAELEKTYEPDKFMTISGAAGSGFMEDTFCFHKGNPPQSRPRLFLQLHFAAHNYGQTKYLDDKDPNTLHSWRET